MVLLEASNVFYFLGVVVELEREEGPLAALEADCRELLDGLCLGHEVADAAEGHALVGGVEGCDEHDLAFVGPAVAEVDDLMSEGYVVEELPLVDGDDVVGVCPVVYFGQSADSAGGVEQPAESRLLVVGGDEVVRCESSVRDEVDDDALFVGDLVPADDALQLAGLAAEHRADDHVDSAFVHFRRSLWAS